MIIYFDTPTGIYYLLVGRKVISSFGQEKSSRIGTIIVTRSSRTPWRFGTHKLGALYIFRATTMVGFIDKLRSQLEMWKVEKYTKRRTFLPEYDSRDTEYYKQHYHDGVYYSSSDQVPPLESRTPTSTQYRSTLGKRMSVMIKKKSSTSSLPQPRCSETYNANFER